MLDECHSVEWLPKLQLVNMNTNDEQKKLYGKALWPFQAFWWSHFLKLLEHQTWNAWIWKTELQWRAGLDFDMEVEMGPALPRQNIWLALNKRITTHLWHNPMRFFWLARKKYGKFEIFRGNFPNPNQWWLTRPVLSRATKKWPNLGQNFLTQTHY